jgi:putative tricarboxylic transport membrane protein
MASGGSTSPATMPQALIGAGVLVLGGVILGVALGIPSDAGYGGVGPDFLPKVVGGVLLLCGVLLVWHAFSGGYRVMDEPSGAERGYWPGFLWMTAALLANAALINTVGFVLSCTVCYALAVRGLRNADLPPGERGGFAPARTARDVLMGMAISAPVFWMFTKLLAINLPGLTSSGWI